MNERERLWRDRVKQIIPYEPGKPIDEVAREYGVHDIVKLASNENPLGPSPMAEEAIIQYTRMTHLYPDAGGYTLRMALSERLDIPVEHIILGNGTAEIIELVTEAFLNPDDNAVTGDQAFFKYRIAIQIMNAGLISLPMPGMQYDMDAMLRAISEGAKIIFVANPNNPTGLFLNSDEIGRLVDAISRDQILVLDEAYYEYIQRDDYPESLDYVRSGKNVIVMRTFSKIYGLAGLRIGYAVSTPGIIRGMFQVKEAFNTNSLAQVAAHAALEDRNHLERTIRLTRAGKKELYAFLKEHNVRFLESEANFVLIDLEQDSLPVFRSMLKKGVIVRPVKGYKLDTHIRVSIGTPAEMERFRTAFMEVTGR